MNIGHPKILIGNVSMVKPMVFGVQLKELPRQNDRPLNWALRAVLEGQVAFMDTTTLELLPSSSKGLM